MRKKARHGKIWLLMPSSWWVTHFLWGDGFADKLWLCYKYQSLPSMFTVTWVSDEWWAGQAASWTVARLFFFFPFSLFRMKPLALKSVVKLHQQRRVSSHSLMYALKNVHTDTWKRLKDGLESGLVFLRQSRLQTFFSPPVQMKTAEWRVGRHDYRYLSRWCSKVKGGRFQFPVNVNVQL